jgi:hypothetical protein
MGKKRYKNYAKNHLKSHLKSYLKSYEFYAVAFQIRSLIRVLSA